MRQSPPMKNIVILISGGGSNMAAIVRASQQQNWAKQYNARVSAVVSNKAEAKGLVFARDNGIATEVLKAYPMDGKPVPTSGTFTPQGKYLNTQVTFTKGDSGPTIMLDPVLVTASNADNPLIWGNA